MKIITRLDRNELVELAEYDTSEKHISIFCVHGHRHTHAHTQHKRGLSFLQGSFHWGCRTADVAKYPTDGERK